MAPQIIRETRVAGHRSNLARRHTVDMEVADELAFLGGWAALELGCVPIAREFASQCFPGKRFPQIRLIREIDSRGKDEPDRIRFYEED